MQAFQNFIVSSVGSFTDEGYPSSNGSFTGVSQGAVSTTAGNYNYYNNYASMGGYGLDNNGVGSAWISLYSPANENCSPDGSQPQGAVDHIDDTSSCSDHWTSYNLNVDVKSTLVSKYGLTSAQDYWLSANQDALKTISDFAAQSPDDQDTADQIIWSINYLMNDPNIDINVFKNQFLSIKEGTDGDYDASYWDNVNVTFPPQTLPTYSNFYDAFPKHNDPSYDTPEKMYASVGGDVLAEFRRSGNPNTCALRVSKGLNYSGVTIPNIPNKTFKGADNKYYFLGAATLKAWMLKTFTTNLTRISGSQGGSHGENFVSLLNNKKGIYIMTPTNPSIFNASGHADLLTYFTCDGGCYFNTAGGIAEILVWVLN